MSKFEAGNVVKFKNGPQVENLWGDKVTLEYFLVSEEDDSYADEGYVRVYSHPYRFALHEDELELVTDDEFNEFPEDYAPGWAWWHDLDDDTKENVSGPNWLEYLG